MKAERTSLIKALDLVKPAIASKALLDELTHVWFGNKELIAYDDVLGIRAPFDADDLAGGVKGALLLGILNASGAKNVEMTIENDGRTAHMKAARAKVKLALLEAERAVWTYPSVKPGDFFALTPELIAGLDDVLISVGTDVSRPDQLGVTLAIEGSGKNKDLVLYTTDSKTIARYYAEIPKGYDEDHLIIPTPFVEQVLRLCAKDGKLAILKDGVLAENKDGVGVFSRVIDASAEPMDFSGALDKALPDDYEKLAVPIPPILKQAVERALVILDGKAAEPIEIAIEDKHLFISVESPLGRLDDTIPLDGDHEHVEIKVDPVLIKRAIDRCDRMLVGDGCLVLLGRKGKFLYAISASA